MPITFQASIRVLTLEDFNRLDHKVMRHAFDSQNELGRLCDEAVYQADLAARLRASGFMETHTRMGVRVSHADFAKTYYVDLLADHGLYELKAVPVFSDRHRAQLIHYMLLLGLRCGKLLNFGSERVDGRLHATRLTPSIRRKITTDASRWQPQSPACEELQKIMLALLADWGSFLEVPLYEEALTHFLGGPDWVKQRVPLSRGTVALGDQTMNIHTRGSGFVVTSFTTELAVHETNLKKLLALCPLRTLQWINLKHALVQFTTLTR
jgi:GxxExxY protein